jgi:hypothetical protein
VGGGHHVRRDIVGVRLCGLRDGRVLAEDRGVARVELVTK